MPLILAVRDWVKELIPRHLREGQITEAHSDSLCLHVFPHTFREMYLLSPWLMMVTVKVSCSANKKGEKVVAMLWQWCYVHGCYTQNSIPSCSYINWYWLLYHNMRTRSSSQRGYQSSRNGILNGNLGFLWWTSGSAELRAVAAVHLQCFRLLCDFIVLTTPWKISSIWCFCPSSCGHMFSDSNSMLELIQTILQSHSTESSAE